MTEPSPRKADRTWLYVGLAFLLAWGGYLALFAPVSRRPLVAPGAYGMAEYHWRLLDLDDKSVEFSRFKGKKIFLNLWATWCGPCVGEMPSIARLAGDPKVKDVAFVCVSTDDSAEPVKKFLAGKNWSMTFLRATDLPSVFQTDGIPATFLIAPDGRIVGAEVGSADWNDPGVVKTLQAIGSTKQ